MRTDLSASAYYMSSKDLEGQTARLIASLLSIARDQTTTETARVCLQMSSRYSLLRLYPQHVVNKFPEKETVSHQSDHFWWTHRQLRRKKWTTGETTTGEDTANSEDIVCAIMNCRLYTSVQFVIVTCSFESKGSIKSNFPYKPSLYLQIHVTITDLYFWLLCLLAWNLLPGMKRGTQIEGISEQNAENIWNEEWWRYVMFRVNCIMRIVNCSVREEYLESCVKESEMGRACGTHVED
jgi:hypothetical protein